MSYTAKENVMKFDADMIKSIEENLNKGYYADFAYNKATDEIFYLYGVRKKPENWPENIRLSDAQIHSLETILNDGKTAHIDLASVIMVSVGEKDVEGICRHTKE